MFKKIKKGVKKYTGYSTAKNIFGATKDQILGTKPKTKQHDLLNEYQQAQLAALTGHNTEGYNDLFGQYRGMMQNPQNDYSRMANWEGEFNQGVVNPALNQMNQLIDNTKHSSNLHSSANRFAQDKVRQNTMDNLSGMRYNQLMTERGMEMQGQEAARQRQLAAMSGLSGLSGQALGTNSKENVVLQGQQGILGPALLGGGMAMLSDCNVKENIEDVDIDKCADIVKAIPLHSFKYSDDVKDYANTEVPQMGWMAQDIEKILPDAVIKVKLGEREVLAIKQDMIYATMFGAMQKLLKENEEMKTRLEALEGGK
jgi:hypothetical protein